MSASVPCRECGVTLTDENKLRNGSRYCRDCANAKARQRYRKRDRTKASSGLFCSQCGNPRSAKNKSGLCITCTVRKMNAERVHGPSVILETVTEHRCPRCSIMTVHPVCRDCRDVCRDLGELDKWVAA